MEINTATTPCFRDSRRRLAVLFRGTGSFSPSTSNISSKGAVRINFSATSCPWAGVRIFGLIVYWFITVRMQKESRMLEKSEPSEGRSLYGVAMSTIKAALLLTLIFQKMYDRELMGDLSYQRSENSVPLVLLLSKGPCRSLPMMGKTQVAILFAIDIQS